jgi:hypothetical protein
MPNSNDQDAVGSRCLSFHPGVVGAHDPQQEAGDSAWILSPEMGSGNGIYKGSQMAMIFMGKLMTNHWIWASGYTIFGQTPTVRFEHGNSYEPQLVR